LINIEFFLKELLGMDTIDVIFRPDIIALALFTVMVIVWSLSKLIKVEKDRERRLVIKDKGNDNVL
jgi:cbb3-type cytochrome oxidase subunit 3